MSPASLPDCLPFRRVGRSLLAIAMGLAVISPALPVAARPSGPRTTHTMYRGPSVNRTIALTFDDGWSADRCLTIADTLDRYAIPGTFFLNGAYLSRGGAIWRSIAARFPIGNHTYHHPDLRTLDERGIAREIERNRRVIEAVTGRRMAPLLRPPYGATDARVSRVAARLGYRSIVMWDTTSGDTGPRATARGVAKAALGGGPGSIVLMHCGPSVTPEALPVVIERYACAGYRFATVEELLAGSAGRRARVNCPPRGLPEKPHSRRPTTRPRPTPTPTRRPTAVRPTPDATTRPQASASPVAPSPSAAPSPVAASPTPRPAIREHHGTDHLLVWVLQDVRAALVRFLDAEPWALPPGWVPADVGLPAPPPG